MNSKLRNACSGELSSYKKKDGKFSQDSAARTGKDIQKINPSGSSTET